MKDIKVLFIHHSTGGNLIKEGNLRRILNEINPHIKFWDHSYNLVKYLPLFIANYTHLKGLSDALGKITGIDYDIVLSNNSPKEYAEIFAREADDYTLKQILQYDVIVFKNCFPTSKITSNIQLEEYKNYYSNIAKNISKYKTKKFIIITPPPLRKELTKSEYADRAKILAAWLKSGNFIKDIDNIFVFDFFSLLADNKGFLKEKYTRFIPIDSHPNKKANKEIAPILAKFIIEVCSKFD